MHSEAHPTLHQGTSHEGCQLYQSLAIGELQPDDMEHTHAAQFAPSILQGMIMYTVSLQPQCTVTGTSMQPTPSLTPSAGRTRSKVLYSGTG